MTPLPDSVQRVAAELQRLHHPYSPRMLDDACRTAQQAADALGIAVGQVAKSIIFRRQSDDVAVLVVTSGDRRVDQRKVEAITGPLGRADASFVKERTGFSIGGVAPLAHAQPGVTLIDRELLRFETLWAAAGHPHAVFSLTPQALQTLTGAPLADVTEAPADPVSATQTIAAHADRLSAAGYFDQNSEEVLPSPCVSVCRMTPDRSMCEGCFRSIDEIRRWSTADSASRRAVWAQLLARAGVPVPASLHAQIT